MHTVVGRGHAVCPLYGGCPLFGVSTIGGSTVYYTRARTFQAAAARSQ